MTEDHYKLSLEELKGKKPISLNSLDMMISRMSLSNMITIILMTIITPKFQSWSDGKDFGYNPSSSSEPVQ